MPGQIPVATRSFSDYIPWPDLTETAVQDAIATGSYGNFGLVSGTAERVEVSRSGRVEARYTRLADLSDEPLRRFVFLTPEMAPPSGPGTETILRVALAPGDGAATFTLKLDNSRSWSLSSSPRLNAVGTEIGVSYVHKASQSLTFEFSLPEGLEYTAAQRLDWAAITWVAIPIPG